MNDAKEITVDEVKMTMDNIEKQGLASIALSVIMYSHSHPNVTQIDEEMVKNATLYLKGVLQRATPQ